MPEVWAADIKRELFLSNLRCKDLAKEMGWNDKYLCTVLNGHKKPKGAEEKCRDALERLKAKVQ